MLNNFNNSKSICNALVFRHNRLCPVGCVESFAGANAPSGWLLCDGTAVSRTLYSVLFNVIGITYGPGNGVSTFNLPDMRGRISVAAGQGVGLTNRVLGAVDGEEKHVLTIAEMPAHTHDYVDTFRNGNQDILAAATAGITAADDNVTNQNKTSASTGGGLAHNVMQPYVVLNHIIKF